MPDISVGLIQPMCDLWERTALVEMKPQGFSLVLRKGVPDLFPAAPPEKRFERSVVVRSVPVCGAAL